MENKTVHKAYQFVKITVPQKTESDHDTLDWVMGLMMSHNLYPEYLNCATDGGHYEVLAQVKMTIPELMDFREKAKRHLNYAFEADGDVVDFTFWVEIETVRQVPITFELDSTAKFWVGDHVLIDYDGGLKETARSAQLPISINEVEVTDERYYDTHQG